MEAIGRRWDVILSMLVCRDQLLRPEVQVVGCCQDLGGALSEMDDLHSLSSAAFSFFGLEFTSWSTWMSGLDFPVRGISVSETLWS